MSDFNIDEVLSSFGKSTVAKKNSNFDVDSILSEFNVKPEAIPETTKRVIINTDPKPPISGISKESSDELNQTRLDKKGGANPRPALPTTSIQDSMAEAGIAAKDLMKAGAADLETGHPYKGVGKVALGALSAVTSPVSGAVEGGIVDPLKQITGSKDIADRAGLVVGSAMPIVPGAGAVTKALPKNKALRTLVESIGPENLPEVVKQLKANPRLAPADLSPKVLQDTQHLFANDGPQINYLKNTSDARMATRKGAITDAYDASGGVSVDLAQKVADLANASKKVGSEQINPLVKAAKPVDVTNTIQNIDGILKPGVMSKISEGSTLALPEVKQALAAAKTWLTNSKELRTGAEDLHDIQKALRRQGYNLTKSSNAGEREIGHALLKVRNDLVSDIDKASPGYAKALENYRDEMHIADAFREGHDKIFTSSKKMENDPSFTKKWFEGLSEHEQQAAKEGARAAIYTEMGVAKNPALAGESVARSDFNKAKMEILFGKEEAETLLKKLNDERTIANTHNKIVEGSQTAMRSASKSQFAMPDKSDAVRAMLPVSIAEGANAMVGGYPLIPTLALAGAKVGAVGKDAVKMKLAREHNARYAQYALPTEGPSRDELIRSLESFIPGPKKSMLSRASNVASKIIP